MKRHKIYSFSCSGVVMIVFALLGIGISTSNEIATTVSNNNSEARTTTVTADTTESYNDINITTEKIEETKECFTESTTAVLTTSTNIENTYEIQTEENLIDDVDVTIEEDENEISIETIETTTEAAETMPETAETTETTTATAQETQETGLFDCMVIDWQEIPIVRLPATQKNVNRNDVVLDTGRWSTERDLFFFGHNTGSFAFLHFVNVGDIIKFYDGSEEELYVVERSELAEVTEDELYIISNSNGTELVYTDFGYETIRLITCVGSTQTTKKRWVVIARKI